MDSGTAETERVTPENIMQVGFGFFASKALLSAVNFGLFTMLAKGSMSAEEIRQELDLDGRGLYDWLDVLVTLGFLEREGIKEEATYRNAPDADLFLDRDKPGYIGGMLNMANDRLYPFWNDLEKALQTGNPQNEIKHEDKDLFEKLYEDEERLRQFTGAMAGVQMGNFKALTSKFDFSTYDRLCDIGGADGELCLQIASAHDHMKCINFDLPKVASIAEEKVERRGLDDRVQVVAGDFWEDDLPEADVITMGNILHDWGLDGKLTLLQKAHSCLPKGGACIVIENIIDNNRSENVFGLLMSLNMLIETRDGFDFTAGEFSDWCEDVGFERCDFLSLAGPASAGIAYK